ncbi:MAG TPA: ABC transporter substrate-binding protein [Actinomycetaceae bacterium]|nr:ABC transporter substrate-binding protein [Actinomycetaceae bacterium]
MHFAPRRRITVAALALLATAGLAACGGGDPQSETPHTPATENLEATPGEIIDACPEPVEGFGVTHDAAGEPLPEPEVATTGQLPQAPITAEIRDESVHPVAEAPDSQLPVTVRSCDGELVEVTDTSRILAVDLYGTLAEITFALGLGDNVIGRDTSTGFPEAADLPVVTPGAHDLSAESILSLNPTVVLTDATIGPREVQLQLRDAGVPVIFFDETRNLETIPSHIRAVAGALGVPEQGEELVSRTQDEITSSLEGLEITPEPPSVAFLYLRGGAVQLLGGPGSGADALIGAIRARDVGTELGLAQPFTPISSETMIEAQPDIILTFTSGLESVGGPEGLDLIPGLAQTEAVAEGRIIDMSDTLLLNFGPRTGRVIDALAEAVYAS